ncbi:hypothetical protein HMF7854_02685 [Sphingomonas ginkgonis]|uniref:DUF4175 domain-containing protein n=1 Tax=Sphingomonas ginkgonis TaxID=2315330 RepID=A0A3R9Z4X8_9SPHN|nr:hypothetical protein [Sphingomonas ginkgonis]RST29851.1 hypothetical protein HMF7854_02685 [Sphingomonas ginkgonis]
MSDGPEWFAPKRFGYGAGLPIAWQGWVLFLGYLAVVTLAGFLLAPQSLTAYLVLVLTLTAMFMWVTAKTTRGGWRWRSGGED